jgi:CheY-like chemotaxis protein
MKNYHVFVVDDDEVFLLLTTKFLEKIKFDENLYKFKNGKEALSHFEEIYNQQDMFLVLLDINMPVMDGWGFLEALKKKAYKRNTFVYMVSASTEESDREKSETYSIVRGYESKPLTADKLEVIKKEIFSSHS